MFLEDCFPHTNGVQMRLAFFHKDTNKKEFIYFIVKVFHMQNAIFCTPPAH